MSLTLERGVPQEERRKVPPGALDWDAARIFLEVVRSGSFRSAAERLELSETIHFLARVALAKYRYLSGAVVCTALMGISAGMFVVLRPTLH